MYDNPEMHVSSAKQLMELHKKQEKEAQRIRSIEYKAAQLASEQVALLRESNELARQSLEAENLRAKQEEAQRYKSTDVVDIKPNLYGFGFNLNEAWRRLNKWLS